MAAEELKTYFIFETVSNLTCRSYQGSAPRWKIFIKTLNKNNHL